MSRSSLIFDIKRYSINDGPGIRVTVFFKGCPLHCSWCHNPESQSSTRQKLYSENRCISCSRCILDCTKQALALNTSGRIETDDSLCNLCGDCCKVCPTHAMEMSGAKFSVEEIMNEIRSETMFLDQSGGGVTFSGGEPLQHKELLIQLLKVCKEEGIHCAVDTSGYAKPEILMDVARYTDLFLYDLKHMDSKVHFKFTGVYNQLILENLKALAGIGKEIVIRIPLVPGFNADDENIRATVQFIHQLPGNARVVNLLPYHSIASRKYEKLGCKYEGGLFTEPSAVEISKSLNLFTAFGIRATVGG